MSAQFLQTVIHDTMGKLRAVALTAEMAEIQMPQIGRHEMFDRVGGGLVGEMSVAAENALFEAPGSVRAILEHFDVMVGFQQQDIGLPKTVQY